MAETPAYVELILKRQNSLGRQMDSLAESVQSLTRMFEAQFRDVHKRLDGMDRRLDGVEDLVRSFASEQVSMANHILNAQQRADQAHRRLDEVEAG